MIVAVARKNAVISMECDGDEKEVNRLLKWLDTILRIREIVSERYK